MSDPIIPRKIHGKRHITMTDTSAITPATLCDLLSDALRRSWGQVRGAPKQLARQIDSNVRTASNLLEGLHAPSAATLVKLMAADDNVFDLIVDITGRKRPLEYEQIQAIKAAVAIMEGRTP